MPGEKPPRVQGVPLALGLNSSKGPTFQTDAVICTPAVTSLLPRGQYVHMALPSTLEINITTFAVYLCYNSNF